MMDRRSLILGMVGLVAAPSIVRAASLMPIKALAVQPEAESGFSWSANNVMEWREDLSGVIYNISPLQYPFLITTDKL